MSPCCSMLCLRANARLSGEVLAVAHVEAAAPRLNRGDDISGQPYLDLGRWLENQVEPLCHEAEEHFGPRDEGWIFKGISFVEDGPRIYFPPGNTAFVQIQLSLQARTDRERGFYQLAHEVVHFLVPNRATPTIMLEEGAAVWFSLMKSSRNYRRRTMRSMSNNYIDALGLF